LEGLGLPPRTRHGPPHQRTRSSHMRDCPSAATSSAPSSPNTRDSDRLQQHWLRRNCRFTLRLHAKHVHCPTGELALLPPPQAFNMPLQSRGSSSLKPRLDHSAAAGGNGWVRDSGDQSRSSDCTGPRGEYGHTPGLHGQRNPWGSAGLHPRCSSSSSFSFSFSSFSSSSASLLF
jgi:hypothetical protein